MKERPAIAAINITGNKAIKEEDLLRVLFDIGLSEGEVFDRLVLDRLQQELIKQYFSQGRYAVTVDARVTELDRNRVRIAIVIDEGDVAKIRHINVVCNETFTDKEIREEFEADVEPFWKFWSKAGQYSREKLSGDIEKLRSFYLDRGYVDINVESTQGTHPAGARTLEVEQEAGRASAADQRETLYRKIAEFALEGDRRA